jgi:starvation-inducible DNA-binding protein
MIDTRNDLPRAAREKLVELLNQRLADLTDLFSQTKQAHWNVKGPGFIALHELFDKAAEAVEDHVDDVAERAVQLGGTAHGTIRMAAARSSLREYPASALDGPAHVAALSDAFAVTGKGIRAAIDTAAELRDADTADLFTEISRSLDKLLWFIEAHGQAAR